MKTKFATLANGKDSNGNSIQLVFRNANGPLWCYTIAAGNLIIRNDNCLLDAAARFFLMAK